MLSLEAFGIRSGHDEQHRQSAHTSRLSEDEFFSQADALLQEIAPIVLNEVTPDLENYPGKWNPGGFMVFPLGVHDSLGSLRFHIWPQGEPRESTQGPNIHNHAWYLASRILIGEYTDTFYRLEHVQSPQAELPDETHGVYETARNAGGQDILSFTGRLVRPIPIQDRLAGEGKGHHIVPSDYHITTIPQEKLAATLIFDSPPFGPTTEVLIKSSQPEIGRLRRPVKPSSAILAKRQIMGY